MPTIPLATYQNIPSRRSSDRIKRIRTSDLLNIVLFLSMLTLEMAVVLLRF